MDNCEICREHANGGTYYDDADCYICNLQAENAKLRKVAETAKGFAYEDRTLEKPEWWWLEELRRSLTEAGYEV